MTDDERINRGHQATHELRVTGDVFDGVKKLLIDRLCAAPSSDPEAVLALHRQIEALALVRFALNAAVSDGLVAQHLSDAEGHPAH